MGHPTIENDTPLSFEHLFATDETGALLLVMMLKATYDFGTNAPLALSIEQAGFDLAGQFHGLPGESSYRIEPEGSFFKPATDVVLIGHADAGAKRVSELSVGLRVGPVRKLIRVVGDRFWVAGLVNSPKLTSPEPFERIALRYENAYGGVDPNLADTDPRAIEPRNPIGTGYRHGWHGDPIRLPNLEDPVRPIGHLLDRPSPTGFGFVGANWQPRSAFAGTYDEEWSNGRKPLLPGDFDRRFFNAAPADQIVPGYLRGNEEVTLLNVTPEGRIDFRLPALAPPSFVADWRRGPPTRIDGVLDTVVIDADLRRLFLTWRCHVSASRDVQDLRSIGISVAGMRGARKMAPLAPTS